MPPISPRRRKQISSTKITPSTSFQVAPRCSVVCRKSLQIKPHRRADQRPEQRAGAADRRLHHQLPGRIEHEGVRRHEALHDAEQAPGEAGIGGRNDEGRQLVAMDIVTDGGGAQRIVADGAQHGADRRAHDAQRDHDADEEPEREERVERPVGVELDRREAEMKARRRNARQPVLAAGIVRQRIELDEIEDLRDRHSDHREVDAGAPERDQADQITDDGRHDRAD